MGMDMRCSRRTGSDQFSNMTIASDAAPGDLLSSCIDRVEKGFGFRRSGHRVYSSELLQSLIYYNFVAAVFE